MPNLFSLLGYLIYFWTNEGSPLEPIHIHICKGAPRANATKVWITSSGELLLDNNSSKIPQHDLNKLLKFTRPYVKEIVTKWVSTFGYVRYIK